MNLIKYCLCPGLVGIISMLPSPATAQSPEIPKEEIATPSPDTGPETEQASPLEIQSERTGSDISQSEVICPPGQFASAFADVLPDHWAYTAVNRLASVPVTCFDFPDNL